MTYDYGRRAVWLDLPGEEPDPAAALGLCVTHAERLRVPLGWATEDRRRGRVDADRAFPSAIAV